jgi:hypothetical protein
METAPKVLVNIGHSIYRFIQTYPYDGVVPGGTLRQQFSQLTIVPAYPTDLLTIRGPVLAIGTASSIGSTQEFYAERQRDQIILVDLYGFVAGQGSEHSNALYLTRLMQDVFWLFDSVGRDDGITLFDRDTASEIGQVEVDQARIRQVPETLPAVEADRFKFVLELELAYTVIA